MRKLSVVLVALALVVGFSVNAMAAQALFYSEKERLATAPTKELEVYGSVRVGTYWVTADKESNSGGNAPAASGFATQGIGALYDDSDLIWALDDGATRFGVRFKSGKVGANVEIRPRDRQSGGSFNSRMSIMRHWYGSYDLGFGTFIVGQTWTPTFNPICNECLLGGGGYLDGFGDFGGSARRAGLQLHAPIKEINGLLKVALLEPGWRASGTSGGNSYGGGAEGPAYGALPTPLTVGPTTINGAAVPANLQYLGGAQGLNPLLQNFSAAGGATPTVWANADQTLPMIEASLSAAFGPTSWTFVAGYGTFDAKNSLTDQTQSIDTWVAGIDGTYSMGPFYLRGKFYYGQNLAALGTQAPSSNANFGFLPALWADAAGNAAVEDVTNWGWFAVAGFKINDMLSLEAGYGERHAEMDDPRAGANVTNKDTHKGWTLFMPISITPAFVITPEILYANFGELEVANAVAGTGSSTVDRGKQVFYGIYWRIDF